jgi:polygalacturonase
MIKLHFLLLLPAYFGTVGPALPSIPDRIFKVSAYGGVGDDHTDNTNAIQATIHAAASASGGVVELSDGNFRSGPLQLASDIRLPKPQHRCLRRYRQARPDPRL